MSELDREKAQIWIDRLRAFKTEGGSVPNALVDEAAKDLHRGPRSVWNLICHGLPKKRGRKAIVLTDEQIVAYFEGYGRCSRAKRILESQNRPAPTLRQYQRGVLRQLDEKQRAYARGGPKEAHAYRLFLERQDPGRMVVLEADHKIAPVWVIPTRGQVPVMPRITLFMCGKTRVICGICISISPTEAEVMSALNSAMGSNPEISPAHGIPRFIRLDNALEFAASGIKDNSKDLGTRLVYTPAYTPNKKGKVERLFQIMDEEKFSMMPCFQDGPKKMNGKLAELPGVEPWPFERFVEETLAWVADYNYKRKHSSIGMTPSEAWNEDKTPINPISREQLRRYTQRIVNSGAKVQPRGVRAHKRWYTDFALEPHIGKKVELRGLPHDKRKVDVWLDGEFLTTALPHDELSDDQKKKILRERALHSKKTAQIATRAKKNARRRHQGVTNNDPMEEVTDLQPTSKEIAETQESLKFLDRLGKSGRRASKRRANSKRKRGDQ